MKKLKGITILESVIAMVITVIIMGMASVFYLGISKTVLNFSKTNKEVASLQQFYFLFKNEMDRSKFIVLEENELHFIFSITEEKKISYLFQQEFILRKQNESYCDTFHFKHSEPEFLFLEQSHPNSALLIEAISFSLQASNTKFDLSFKKEYPNAMLINAANNGH